MLYTKDKSGKPRYWDINIEVRNGNVFLVKRFGQVGGKETSVETEIKSGKNIGKKNETTKLRQAELQMQSLIKKQKDSGYVEDKSQLENHFSILPMLAHKYDGKIKEPFYIQPKLDGVRMLIGNVNGEIIVMSRTGKPVHNMDHITNEIGPHLKEGYFVDGENYNPNLTFEEITSLCRTTLQNTGKNFKEIKFYIFDFFDIHDLDQTFEKRMKYLKKFESTFKNIFLVETKLLSDKNKIQEWHDMYVKNGYEGIMLRDPMGKYTLGTRTKGLLKFKTFQTEEYKIINAEEATGRDVKTVVWICETSDGQPFNVRPKGSLEKRKEWLKNKSKYIGKNLTVQFQNLTDAGIPRFPVGLEIRDYE